LEDTKGHMAGNESELAFLPLEVQGVGTMYSTVNDLLKFLSANMGLIDTKLNDAMRMILIILTRAYMVKVAFE
jgi:hypothetical protein